MHATYIYDERTYHIQYKAKSLLRISFRDRLFFLFCMTKQRLVENRVIQNV